MGRLKGIRKRQNQTPTMTVRVSEAVYYRLVDIAIERDCTLYEAWDFFFKEKGSVREKVVTKIQKVPANVLTKEKVLHITHGKAPTGSKTKFLNWLYENGFGVVEVRSS